MNSPQPAPATSGAKLQTGLAIASLVLGVLAIIPCFTLFTALPAIITGHLARRRARRHPQFFGGRGLALAGLILAYVGGLFFLVITAFVTPKLAKDAPRFMNQSGGRRDSCEHNLKQISLAVRIWSNEHKETYPPDFLSVSNELGSPVLLVCPQDGRKSKSADFAQFNPKENVSYEYLVPNRKEADVGDGIILRCPVHGHVMRGDGSFEAK